MGLIIDNGLVISGDAERHIWPRGAVAMEGDRIVRVGPREEVVRAYPGFERRDAGGMAVLPGLVNGHSHTALSVLRGMVEDVGRRSLHRIYFPFMELMTEEDVEVMASLGCLETVKSGTTCLVELYSGLDPILEAVDRVGCRAVAGEMIRDVDLLGIRDGDYRFDPRMRDDMLRQGMETVDKWHGRGRGRIQCLLSPLAPDMCSAGFLKEVRELAEKSDLRVHTHLDQSPVEVEQVLAREGMRPAEFLESVGLVGPRLTAAHCFLAAEREIEILGQSGTNVAHCSGIAARRGYSPPIPALKKAGANVCLGSDNMTGDMMETMRLALMIGRIVSGDDTALPSAEVLEMATMGGARAVGLDTEIGSLEAGKKADLVLLDMKKPHLEPVINPVAGLVHYGLASDVDTVMVGGRVIMADRSFRTIDEEAVMSRARQTAKRLWKEFERRKR